MGDPMTRDRMKEIWASVQDNHRRLRECPKHSFPPLVSEYGKKYVCAVCGGSAEYSYLSAYCEGYKAAGGATNDIVPNYTTP